MTTSYKMKGTVARPTHLFRYTGGVAEYLNADVGEWVRDNDLNVYRFDDPLGADDIDRATARRVAAALGWPMLVPEHDDLPAR